MNRKLLGGIYYEGKEMLIDEIIAEEIGCEYGEY